jgi:hypothetical protein
MFQRLNLICGGHVRLDWVFNEVTTKGQTCTVFSEEDDLIEFDNDRNITITFNPSC